MNRKKSKENKEHDANRKEQRESIPNRTQKCNPNPNPRGERARGLPGPRVTAAAGARDVFAPPLAGHLGTEKPPACRSGTLGFCACGAREPGAIHGELDGGALTHRRARTPASKPRRCRFALSSAVAMAVASAPWLPPRSVEREGGGENDARVWGAATATRFLFRRKPRTSVRSKSTAARASRLLGRQAAQAGGGGDAAAGRFGGLAVGCRASGPRKGGRAGRGPVLLLGC